MNYRHAYHAGNFADVFKHSILALVIGQLRRKDAPFAVLDTHAGAGLYDLDGPLAAKTGEWQAGIGRVLAADDAPPEALPYLEAVRAMPRPGLYPGSPALALALMRPQDRLMAVELHPEECRALKSAIGADSRAAIHALDGYAALKALLPPRPLARGLVLIDPPFEEKDELHRMADGLALGLARWPQGIFALWYPIKSRRPVDAFLDGLAVPGRPPILVAELNLRRGDDPFRLNGNGLVLVNPPWKLDEVLPTLLAWLARTLAPEEGGWRLDWLIRDG